MRDPAGDNFHVFHVAPEHEPVLRRIGLDAEGVFTHPAVKPWRRLPDRENCTLDADLPDGRGVRFHVKRYPLSARFGSAAPAEEEVRGYEALVAGNIPTAPLVGWGKLKDGRSFVITENLAGYVPGDKLIEAGTVDFDRLLEPTADLAAKLHGAGLHHRDLYLCHFMAKLQGAGPDTSVADVRLIDVARVHRLPGFLTRRRWVVKDLAQFWYSTTKLPVTDAHRLAWLAQYTERRGINNTGGLRRAIERKASAIARHDRKLNAAQPSRNISIPKN